jgi:purine-binding chemotaxis protein CheW
VESAQEHVVVRLAGCRYGLAMPSVAEVGRPPSLTRVPGLPEWVAGAANWRGRVLAVLDVRGLLAGQAAPVGRSGRMVVLTRAGVSVGLLVEAVEGALDVAPDSVEPALLNLPSRTAALLAGQVTTPDGPCALLDLDAVFALSDELPRARRAG